MLPLAQNSIGKTHYSPRCVLEVHKPVDFEVFNLTWPLYLIIQNAIYKAISFLNWLFRYLMRKLSHGPQVEPSCKFSSYIPIIVSYDLIPWLYILSILPFIFRVVLCKTIIFLFSPNKCVILKLQLCPSIRNPNFFLFPTLIPLLPAGKLLYEWPHSYLFVL